MKIIKVDGNWDKEGFHPEAIAKSLATLCRHIKQEQKDTSKGASGDENNDEAKEPLKQQILLMTTLMKPPFVNMFKTNDIKTFCKNVVPIFYQVPIMMQAGGGDEQSAFERSPPTLEKCLVRSEEQLTNGSLKPVGQKYTVSSQHDERSFLKLNSETRPQAELVPSSSEMQLISEANAMERYFTLQIENFFKHLAKENCTNEKKVVDNLENYLRNIIWAHFLTNTRTLKTNNDSNQDNSRLEMAMLQTWDEAKEAETNLAIEVNNVVEKNRSYETMTGNYYESVPDLLKKAYSILMKIKNDKVNTEFKVRRKMFHDKEKILEEFRKD